MEFPLHRRLRAARALAGYDNQIEFVELIPGMSSRGPINKIENGRQKPTAAQLIAWARACGLPLEFFFVDLADLKSVEWPDDPLAVLEQVERQIQAMR